MLLGRKALAAGLAVFAWVIISFYYRVAAIDANTAQTASEVVALQRRIEELDQRVSEVNDGLTQATSSMNDMRPELAGNVAEVKTMLQETLPALRADLSRLSSPPAAGRR